MSSIKLADGTIVSEYGIPYIIAEVNSSHNGSTEVARKMIDAAKTAGCDCVKFQSWSSKSLYSKTYYDSNPIAKRFVEKFSFSSDELKEMSDYCRSVGIGFSSTPYSREEVDFLVDKCNVPFVKIASMEVNNPAFISYIAKKNVPIILSTGMSDYTEIEQAVKVIEAAGNKSIVILHCVSIYPTPIEKANIRNILGLRNMFPNYPIGFSDHTLGDSVSVAATVLGAGVLEKHITLDSRKIGMDNQMAMEPDDLKELVSKCKLINSAMGTEKRVLSSEEIAQRENMRRSVVVTRNLKAGDVIGENDLDAKRPGTGIAPYRIPDFIGKRVKKDMQADTLLDESDVI